MKISLLLFAFVALTVSVQAQKFGYINSQLIMSEMSQVKEMNANLESLQKVLQKKGQDMVKNLQSDFQAVQVKVERGELSPQQQETEAKRLEDEQKKIGDFEKDMQQQLAKKQQTLMTPILEKVNKAIEDVAKENGYTMIFDSSAGVLLYAEEEADLSAQVKAKLGL